MSFLCNPKGPVKRLTKNCELPLVLETTEGQAAAQCLKHAWTSKENVPCDLTNSVYTTDLKSLPAPPTSHQLKPVRALPNPPFRRPVGFGAGMGRLKSHKDNSTCTAEGTASAQHEVRPCGSEPPCHEKTRHEEASWVETQQCVRGPKPRSTSW